jgi:hypothetical protein
VLQFSGFPVSSNFLTAGANYNITHNSWSGNISAWEVSKKAGVFNPSVIGYGFPGTYNKLCKRSRV